MEQTCDCQTVIECTCPSRKFTAKLADFDFIKEITATQDGDRIWTKLLPYMPGGTVGMQAPEVQLKVYDSVQY